MMNQAAAPSLPIAQEQQQRLGHVQQKFQSGDV